MLDFWLTKADAEFYVPLEKAVEAGEEYTPEAMPADWRRTDSGIWRSWTPPEANLAGQGWKIHVSTTADRLRHTLDTVAAACVAEGVTFKHLRARLFFEAVHDKNAARSQAGKFSAVYPPDEDTARRLLDRLAADLAGEVGPYVLSDRRYGAEGVVHYRYGAFLGRDRVRLDGTREPLMLGPGGEDLPDVRGTGFVLPPGVEDPFAPPATAHEGAILLNGRYEVVSAIRHTNGGGTYQATDTRTGSRVFVKEAVAHNGLIGDGTDARDRLRREHGTMRAIHAAVPGLCPEPVDYFTEWEHEFLVTEYIDGTPFLQWVAAHTVMGRIDGDGTRQNDYLAKVRTVLDSLTGTLERLHAIGIRFGDLSHGNVMVLADQRVRLIDFETANPLTEPRSPLGTAGYKPLPHLVTAGVEDDEYGLAGLALFALFPLTSPLERDPRGRFELLRRDLEAVAPLPDDLWRAATRYHGIADPDRPPAPTAFDLPTAAELDADPRAALTALYDGVAAGLAAMARPDRDDWVYPPPPEGYTANTHCVAHGTAGVLYALRQCGLPVPDEIRERFRRDALAARDTLAPGLFTGAAGIAWTLADLGLPEEAADLLDASLRHPLTFASAGYGHGGAGIGLAHLRLHAELGGDHRLLVATKLGDAFSRDDRDTVLAQDGTPGLETGLSGTALFLDELARYTGEERYRTGALALLHAELDRGHPSDEDGLQFKDGGDTRIISYLAGGSAGVATVLTRLAAATGDERCLAALPRVLTMCRMTCSVQPGLLAGVGSWVFALAEHADHAGGPDDREAAVRVATGLAKYAIRHPTGLRLLGPLGSCYQADLGAGSAGTLLALARLLHGPRVRLFTLDPHARADRPAGARTLTAAPA